MSVMRNSFALLDDSIEQEKYSGFGKSSATLTFGSNNKKASASSTSKLSSSSSKTAELMRKKRAEENQLRRINKRAQMLTCVNFETCKKQVDDLGCHGVTLANGTMFMVRHSYRTDEEHCLLPQCTRQNCNSKLVDDCHTINGKFGPFVVTHMKFISWKKFTTCKTEDTYKNVDGSDKFTDESVSVAESSSSDVRFEPIHDVVHSAPTRTEHTFDPLVDEWGSL